MGKENRNPFLSARTSTGIGSNIIYEPEMSSTNTRALELLRENVENGTVVITDHQTQGRGRGPNVWESSPGTGLTFSVILYPHLPISYSGFTSIVAGVSIVSGLEEFGIKPTLKWPNDVYYEGKKLGGILCESHVRKGRLDSIVVGIGINVNEQKDSFPSILNEKATSMSMITGISYNRAEVLKSVLHQMNVWINIWAGGATKNIIAAWISHCHHMHRHVKFRSGKNWVEGSFTGLSDHGEAILKTESGIQQYQGSELQII